MSDSSSDRIPLAWASAMLVVAVLLPGSDTSAQSNRQTVDLRPHFVQGQTTKYHIWSLRQQTQSVTIGNNSHDFDSRFEIEGEIVWTIHRVGHDGSATCLMTVEWLTAQYTSPEGQTQYSDSRKMRGEPAALHGLLRAMAGVDVTVEVESDGTVRSVHGIDAIERAAPQDVAVPDELDFIESASDLATIAAAGALVAINDRWEARLVGNHPLGKIHQLMRYQLQSVEQIADIPVATVTGSAKLKFELDKDRLPKVASRDWRVSAKMTDGQIDTQILFDLQRHEAVGRNTLETRQVDVKLSGPQQSILRRIDEQIHSQILRVHEK